LGFGLLATLPYMDGSDIIFFETAVCIYIKKKYAFITCGISLKPNINRIIIIQVKV